MMWAAALQQQKTESQSEAGTGSAGTLEVDDTVSKGDELDPSIEEQQTQVDEQKTQVDEQKSQVDEQKTQDNEQKSQVDEQKSKGYEQKAKGAEQKTQVDEQKAKVHEQKSKGAEQKRKGDEANVEAGKKRKGDEAIGEAGKKPNLGPAVKPPSAKQKKDCLHTACKSSLGWGKLAGLHDVQSGMSCVHPCLKSVSHSLFFFLAGSVYVCSCWEACWPISGHFDRRARSRGSRARIRWGRRALAQRRESRCCICV